MAANYTKTNYKGMTRSLWEPWSNKLTYKHFRKWNVQEKPHKADKENLKIYTASNQRCCSNPDPRRYEVVTLPAAPECCRILFFTYFSFYYIVHLLIKDLFLNLSVILPTELNLYPKTVTPRALASLLLLLPLNL